MTRTTPNGSAGIAGRTTSRMRRGRRQGLIAVIAAAALSLSACASAAGPAESKSGDSGDKKVAFISQIEGIPYFSSFNDGAKAAAEKLGVAYTQAGPATVDATEQLRIFNSLVQQDYDAIAVSALDARSLNPAIAKARAKGVTVITSDSDAPDSEREVMVLQATDEGLAKAWVDQLVEATGDSGEYAIVSGAADATNMTNWSDGIIAYQTEKFPNLKLVGGVRYTTDTAQALKEAQDLMTAYPSLNGILSLPASALPGVAQAVQNADKIGKVQVIGLASPQSALPFFESGAVYSTVMWDVEALGNLTVWSMNELLAGTSFKAKNTVPGIKESVTYDAKNKVLLLGPPVVFNKKNASDYNF
jgi:ABC-type sugar transport system substrate-binding protein